MIKALIVRAILFFVRLISSIPPYSQDVINIAKGRHNNILAEHAGLLPNKDNYKGAVVIALYPSENTIPFTINLMRGFSEAGFYVLGVSTKKLSSQAVEKLLPHGHRILERFNIGYDFGSYQLGIRWLERQPFFKNIDALAIANDSLFYPAAIADTIKNMMDRDSDWIGLFENFEIHYHVGSFFEIFRSAVFTSEVFKNFWINYKPFSIRTHAINEGEAGLTRVLIGANFVPNIVYDSESIQKAILGRLLKNEGDPDIMRALSTTRKIFMTTRLGKIDDIVPRVSEYIPDRCIVYELASKVAAIAEKRNPTHAIGLLCNVLFQAPIKCDIVNRDSACLADVLDCARGFTDEELLIMKRYLRTKGLPASMALGSWSWFQRAVGVI